MSSAPTARLINAHGKITLHTCVRLVIIRLERADGPPAGHLPGIYPIYQCAETESESIFGCLRLDLLASEIDELFPGIVLECSDDLDELDGLDALACAGVDGTAERAA